MSSAGQPTAKLSMVKTNASGLRTVKAYPRVRFLPNGLLDVDRKKGKFFKLAQENQQVSPFLQLPPEIRSTIYECSLGNETFTIAPKGVIEKNKREDRWYLALNLVSRQIYVETVMLPFKLNIFEANHPQSLQNWASDLSIAAQHSITRIRLSTSLHWHAYLRFADELKPGSARVFPAWWSQPRNFDGLPALRQVCFLTTLAQCYCDKPKAQTDALTKFIGDSEDALKEVIETSHKGILSKDIDVIFQRDLDFAPLVMSMDQDGIMMG